VLWEAACALGHAHQRGVVHRDVKPANIMFDHDGRVMLTDFGISKALQAASGFTGTGMIIGTPHYMAPEAGEGRHRGRPRDQYSLGVVAYRMITGELPYTGDSVHTILYKHIFEEIPSARAKRSDAPEFLTRRHLPRALQGAGAALRHDGRVRDRGVARAARDCPEGWREQEPAAAPAASAPRPLMRRRR